MQLVSYTYPFDPNGTAPTNKVVGERHTISPVNGTDFRFIVPRAAPYFRSSMRLRHVASDTPLLEGIHWAPGHKFVRASNTPPFMAIYGSVLILDNQFEGTIELTEYQTLGGEFTINEAAALELLANAQLDPRLAQWDNVLNKPTTYDSLLHRHHVTESTGYEDFVASLNGLSAAIVTALTDGAVDQQARSHIQNMNNPHNTRQSQVIGGEHLANLTAAHVTTIINAINGDGGLGGGGANPTPVNPGVVRSRNRVVFNNTTPNSLFTLNPEPQNLEWVEWVEGPISFVTNPVMLRSAKPIEGSTEDIVINGKGEGGLLIYFSSIGGWKLYRTSVGAGGSSGGIGQPGGGGVADVPWVRFSGPVLGAARKLIPQNQLGNVQLELPTNPSDLFTIQWKAGPAPFSQNKFIITPTDRPLSGDTSPIAIDTDGECGELVYFAAEQQWVIYRTGSSAGGEYGSGGPGGGSTPKWLLAESGVQLKQGQRFIPDNETGEAVYPLPENPSDGASVEWVASGTLFSQNQMRLVATDKPIMGNNSEMTITEDGTCGELIFNADLGYWTAVYRGLSGLI